MTTVQFLAEEDSAPLKTQWHHHLVSSLLGAAGGIGGGSRDGHGNRAEVRERLLPDEPLAEVVVHRYQATGAELDPAPIVVTRRLAPAAEGNPALGLGPSGHFVVAWHETAEHRVLARRFDPRGMPLGDEFTVNTSTEQVPRLNPVVAVNAAGACVVLWEHGWTHLRARLFGPQGQPFGPEIDICLSHRPAGRVL